MPKIHEKEIIRLDSNDKVGAVGGNLFDANNQPSYDIVDDVAYDYINYNEKWLIFNLMPFASVL